MEPLSLVQLFGVGAYQDESVLVIQKSSLTRFIPTANNTAESLVIGILITASLNFVGTITNESNQAFTNDNNQLITFDNSEAFELIKIIEWNPFAFIRNSQQCIRHQIIINSYASN